VELKSNGVVCDQEESICYDRGGPSLSETRRRYGRAAEQRLLRRLSGRPPVREVRFSSGELCDFQRRECWDDGWRRRNVSKRLNRHLFGSDAGEGDRFGSRRCRLSRGSRRYFDGSCRLSTVREREGRGYLVETSDGRRYVFRRLGGNLLLQDGTGSWRVRTGRRSDSVLFRWSDFSLEVSRRGRDGVPAPYGLGESIGPGDAQVLEQLLESFFR
jgi:hypothetical protein